ncbi:polysaccharide deacetylase family protein [Edaphobacter aggregans]|uniref:polysaccharide deacetylase family protein n=1 Tax=Edaphobacter aggregans TaxID=570835 RepID=UPI00068EFD6A|nr:polysaccharide deacetylase family protein [Edaphobacter aggregans]
MSIPSIARRVFRLIRGRRAAPAILMYHRVIALEQDPWDLAVSPETFERQLAYLKSHRTAMPLDQLVEGLRNGNLPRNAVAITFDDGYRDNLVHAKPLLKRYHLPATLFLATGWVGSSVPFWWDELAGWTLQSRQAVDYTVLVSNETFSLRWGVPETADIDGKWRASGEPQTARQRAYLGLWRKLRDVSQAERVRVMASVRGTFGGVHNSLSLPMNHADVQELTQDGLITLGAHTIHHPALTTLTAEDCREEILASTQQCRMMTGVETSLFAYPYGDMNDGVRNIVAGSGFASACSTRSAHINVAREDRYELPRFAVLNRDMAQFKALLNS